MRERKPIEFYRHLAKKSGVSVEDCQDVCENLVAFIIEELRNYGSLSVPNLGRFHVKNKGGKFQHMPISNDPKDAGKTKMVYIEPFLQCGVTYTDGFKDALNGRKFPKATSKMFRKEYSEKQRIEAEAERQIKIVEKKRKALEEEQEKRLERIARRKAYLERKKKKEKNKPVKPAKELELPIDYSEIEKEAEVNEYDYVSLKDLK